MKRLALALAAAIPALSGCVDTPEKSITDPPARVFAFVPAAACSPATRASISTQVEELFNDPYKTQALHILAPLFNNCSANPAAAASFMLGYVQFTIDQFKAGNVKTPASGTAAEAVLSHWNYLFSYVGYIAPELPPDVFGPEGAAGVIGQATANRELAAANAAITVPVQTPQGDQRTHLYVIYPLPSGCLTGTNLVQSGPCFEFGAYPAITPNFNPKVKVGICQPIDANEPLPQFAPALGHLTGGLVKVPVPQVYPTFCAHADHADAAVFGGGLGGMAKRFARLVSRTFGPQPLYAVHGGLGGLGKGLSPFQGVDLVLFQSLLSGQTIGSPPTADEGVLTSDVTDPAITEVRASLGYYNDTLIVLRRKPPQCFSCGNLLLRANLTDASGGAGANIGIYDVSWMSLQERLKFNQAPFVLRSSSGLEIARVTYAVTPSNPRALLFNGIPVGSWTKDTPQHFVIRVNLNTKRASLMIDGTIVSTNRPFVQGADNLGSIGAEFSLIDAGVIGWAEIKVQRQPDE